MPHTIAVLCCLIMFIATNAFSSRETSDSYISGAAVTILKVKYSIEAQVEVRNGEIFLGQDVADNPEYASILNDLLAIGDVKKVTAVSDEEMKYISGIWVFPGDSLFRPLLADPHWPKFSMGYHYFMEGIMTDNTLQASLGKTFPLIKKRLGEELYGELSLQAGISDMFNTEEVSWDLVNSDYMLGIPLTMKWKKFSLMARFYHRSTHIGDEYIVNNNIRKRINLSINVLELMPAFEPNDMFRLYAGGGYIPWPQPHSFGHWQYSAGAEMYISPLSPKVPNFVAALHVHGESSTDYKPGYSLVAGVEVITNGYAMLEYYGGPSPHGQFYSYDISYVGASFYFY